jgi:hypothetical protein
MLEDVPKDIVIKTLKVLVLCTYQVFCVGVCGWVWVERWWVGVARPSKSYSKQPPMVRTFLKVHARLRLAYPL